MLVRLERSIGLYHTTVHHFSLSFIWVKLEFFQQDRQCGF